LAEFYASGEEVDFTPGQYFWVTLLDPPYEDGPYEEALELLAEGLVNPKGYVTAELLAI